MRVVFSAEAKRDLLEIGDFIAKDSPTRAKSFVIELRDKARKLADMPSAFSIVPELERHGIRRRSHGDYLIFYRVHAAV